MAFARRLLASALLPLLLVAPAQLSAQPTDAAVKAAFLPRFARYVEWPPQVRPPGAAPMVLCVVGSDPFGSLLERAARSQMVDGHRILVRRFDNAPSSAGCHVAFVRGNRSLPTGQLLAAMANRPVLTVTDAADGGPRGIIHFQVVGNRVRFLIDNAGARRKGLTLSSRLLALAIEVRGS
nr:YfiR family protein [uncultured Sphingomonas sp.]